MTLVERRIFRINDFVDNINPAQICVEPMEDPDLDFRMYCGTDILGNATKWLAKDQKARITDLSITDRLNMNTNDVVNVGALYAPWTDLDNDTWARLRFYYNGAYPTSEFVQARPNLECGVRLDATQSKADFFCDTNRGLFFNGPEMALKDYDADTSKYNFLLTSDSSGTVIDSEIKMTLGSAGSLSFYDANKAGYTNEGIPLSSSGQWENIVSLAGDNCTLFGAILAAGATTLQDAYNNGGSVVTSSGPTYWVWPVDGGNGSPFSIANNDTDNESAVLQIANESVNSEKYGIMFSGASGDASLSGALGHKIWTADSISIGRTNSAAMNSYFAANSANISDTVVAAKSGIYSNAVDDFDNAVEAFVTVESGKQGSLGSRSRTSTLYAYSQTGTATVESGLGGKLLLSNNSVFSNLSGLLGLVDVYRSGSSYTATSIPLSKSIAEWTAFAAIAGVEGSLLAGIAAAKLGPAIGSGHIAYGTGTSITGKDAFTFDPASNNISIGGLSATTRVSIAGTLTSGSSYSSRVFSTTASTAPSLALSRSNHATLGTQGAVTTGSVLGDLFCYGSDGSRFVLGSQISTVASGAGAWSTTDNQAADMVFSTINAGSFAEKMRLSASGYLGIGVNPTEHRLQVSGTDIVTSTIRTDCYSTTASDYGSLRMYRSNASSGYGALAANTDIGRIRFIGSRASSWIQACEFIARTTDTAWSSTGNEACELAIQLRHAGTTAQRMLLTSMGGLALGQYAIPDWTMGHFLASQRLDGSTAGSSQSIVAMTLGLRTTSTTANQVLKLTSSDSASPLVMSSGYMYSFIVTCSATFGAGDKKGWITEVYHITSFYTECSAKLISTDGGSSLQSPSENPGSFSFAVSSNILNIRFSPSAYCSVDNPINVLATISTGTKTQTGNTELCN